MKRYTTTAAAAINYPHQHPDRTAYRDAGNPCRMEFDVVFQVWPNRASMAKTIRMQQRRAPAPKDWKPVVPLGQTEGF